MAGDVVIRAEGLGKKYLIGHQTEARATTLREALGRSARGLARSAGAMMKGRPLVAGDAVEEFWALKDVSFEVKRGEVVGVIGRNGAGKSTLLKILSRITEPTEGRVAIKGRVASLLEVGTGFHPELTGRENIFLNGAILGMTRAEIRRKFDEIVDFAGIEKFLDTPVKRYSSGMYVRLAFAVAAHLEPEILIVDEVLAVGDAEFQKKCLGKMQDVAGHGRTVLFVSHNMAAIDGLCDRAIILTLGKIRYIGSKTKAIELLRSDVDEKSIKLSSSRIRRAEVQSVVGETPIMGGDFRIWVELTDVDEPHLGFQFRRRWDQMPVFGFNTEMIGYKAPSNEPRAVIFEVSRTPLLAGEYSVDISLRSNGDLVEKIDSAILFEIIESDVYGTGRIPFAHSGSIFPTISVVSE
ncbi:ABC transporter ATP-binding protein [Prosthecomicrobium pneumaticum]|uniref:Lipopolysaccharide transport system ATP-binding protein n=1 Tax=Prosthecomicrobium pneumaticum TaxID=81895 RepID=A0A7W9FJN0_9HYPH|nr:ABC transporter ATP-binding protein [Prosthecomicrobium pneumaticum]MBB5751887.1 lipopolysaccharide transport system ATP-binding protein [Prosthecomicrobium pneumaticum]